MAENKPSVFEQLVFNVYMESQVSWDPESILGKSREEIQKEIDDMSDSEIAELLETGGETVDETFEDGGRWSNYKSTVCRFRTMIDGNREGVYVEISEEVPATEMQEGGDFGDPEFEIVYPHKIETTVYKGYPQDKPKGAK
jgi:hypothetical protein